MGFYQLAAPPSLESVKKPNPTLAPVRMGIRSYGRTSAITGIEKMRIAILFQGKALAENPWLDVGCRVRVMVGTENQVGSLLVVSDPDGGDHAIIKYGLKRMVGVTVLNIALLSGIKQVRRDSEPVKWNGYTDSNTINISLPSWARPPVPKADHGPPIRASAGFSMFKGDETFAAGRGAGAPIPLK